MICTSCGSEKIPVKKTRKDCDIVKRLRICENCSLRIETEEKIISVYAPCKIGDKAKRFKK